MNPLQMTINTKRKQAKTIAINICRIQLRTCSLYTPHLWQYTTAHKKLDNNVHIIHDTMQWKEENGASAMVDIQATIINVLS